MQRSLRLIQPSLFSCARFFSVSLKYAAQPRRTGLNSAMTALKQRPLAPLSTSRILSSCRFRLLGAIFGFGALRRLRL
jgi:hypothetical protein